MNTEKLSHRILKRLVGVEDRPSDTPPQSDIATYPLSRRILAGLIGTRLPAVHDGNHAINATKPLFVDAKEEEKLAESGKKDQAEEQITNATPRGASAYPMGTRSLASHTTGVHLQVPRPIRATGQPHANARRTSQLPPYRAVLAVDTKDFSASPSSHQERLSQDIPALLQQALEQCGLSRLWDTRVFGSSTGDGYYFGVDATDAPFLVNPFLAELDELLTAHDETVRVRDRNVRLRLRASIHLGPIPDSGLSTAMNETHRLLDAEPVRTILDRSDPDVTFLAAILSQRVFTDVIRGDYVKLRASQFAAHTVKVKSFEDVGYLYTPTRSVHPELLDGIDEAQRLDAKELEIDQQRPRYVTQDDFDLAGSSNDAVVHNNFSGTSISTSQIGQAEDSRYFTTNTTKKEPRWNPRDD